MQINKKYYEKVPPVREPRPSSLITSIECSYSKLTDILGEPTYRHRDDYKVDAEWVLYNGENKITVYNYKDGKNYLGEEGFETEDITDWHIGGSDKHVSEHFKRNLEEELRLYDV